MMRKILTLFFIALTTVSRAQDTTYLDGEMEEVLSFKEAHFYQTTRKDSSTNRTTLSTFFKSGQIKSLSHYINDDNKKIYEGEYKEWFEDGQIKVEAEYRESKLDGKLLTYWKNGKPKRIDTYANDTLITGKCYDVNGKRIPHFEYEQFPEFPGGMNRYNRYLSKSIKYPMRLRKEGVEGKALVKFVIEKDGSVVDVKLMEKVHPELDQLIIQIFQKMPKWKPGKQDGEPVRVSMLFPINFALEDLRMKKKRD